MCARLTSVLLYLIISSNIVLGHPIKGPQANNVELKNEKKYPNGTVVGKYTYKDNDGNPIHVKYYADDSSYGVELKSVKVFGSHPELLKDKTNFDNSLNTQNAFGSLDVINTANSLLKKDFYKNKTYNTFEELDGFPKESLHKGNKKENDVYEIFLENDLIKPSEKCDKQRVRVYSDKTKRKIRQVPDNNNKFFCERY